MAKKLEKHVEIAARSVAKNRGWLFWKLTVMGFPGLPDRVILAPRGRVAFVEFKAPGKKPTELQAAWHRRLQSLGFKVYVIDNLADFEAIIV